MTVQEGNKTMTKQEAFKELERVFEGYEGFISQCKVLIGNTPDFIGIESIEVQKDNWNWSLYLFLSINHGKHGFKQLHYKKGNKRYGPGKLSSGRCNSTSDIHEYFLVSYDSGKVEKFSWDA